MNPAMAQHAPSPAHFKLGRREEDVSMWGADYTVPDPEEEEEEEENVEEDMEEKKAVGDFQWCDKSNEDWGSPEYSNPVEMDVSVTGDFIHCLTQTGLSPLKERRLARLRYRGLRCTSIRYRLAQHWKTWRQRAKWAGSMGYRRVRRCHRRRRTDSRLYQRHSGRSLLNGDPEGLLGTAEETDGEYYSTE